MNRPVALLLLGCAGVGVASLAAAQTRHDTSAPIDIGAQHGELQDRANRALLTGAVVIKQAEMTLKADRATILYTGAISDGSPEISRLDASGNVYLTRPNQSASAQYAVYDIPRHLITMVGGVTLTQGTNRLTGGRLSINLDTGRATLDGTGMPAGAPGVSPDASVGGRGRVTGRFSVPKRN